jgi:hypothetical protein
VPRSRPISIGHGVLLGGITTTRSCAVGSRAQSSGPNVCLPIAAGPLAVVDAGRHRCSPSIDRNRLRPGDRPRSHQRYKIAP